VEEEFKGIDALVEYIRFLQEKNKDKAMLFDPQRLLEFKQCYDRMLSIAKETTPDATPEIHMNWFGMGDCSFSIETDEFEVREPNEFILAIKDTTNFEVYPLLNGKIRIGVMFKDVMVSV